MKIKIYGLIIETDYISPSFEPFKCIDGEPEAVFRCVNQPFSKDKAVLVAEHDAFSVFSSDGRWLYETPSGEQLLIDRDYSEGFLYIRPAEDKRAQNLRILVMFRVAVECRFAGRGVVSLHSACVELNGKALAFTGVSGTGKSTRAEVWVKHFGARWISGDRPVADASRSIVSGLPWDGKEQIFCNRSCLLHAVLDVRRSQSTRLRRLSAAQARRVLMQQCFIPMWDTQTASLVIKNIYKLTQNTPIYRLYCDRDEKAAQDVYRALFGGEICAEREEIDLKIKEGFALRNVAGEYIVMPTGGNVARFDGTVVLNEVSAFIYEKLQNSIAQDDLLMHILDEYDVEPEVAQGDLSATIERFREYGMLDEEK